MAYWRLYYHFVWGTKDRLSLINDQIEARISSVMAEKAHELGAMVHAIGGIEDHVHLIVSVPPKVALSEFIGQVKGSSSHFVNHVILPDYYFAWQNTGCNPLARRSCLLLSIMSNVRRNIISRGMFGRNWSGSTEHRGLGR